MTAIRLIEDLTFTKHNIRSAFKKSGIYPVDKERIVTFLRLEYRALNIET